MVATKIKNPKVTVNTVQELQKAQGFNGAKAKETLLIFVNMLLYAIRVIYYIGESIYKKFSPTSPKPVKGEIVLITGTGHGIGRELALAYASEGATVVGVDIYAKNNEETIKEISENGYPKAYSYICDISNRKQIEEIAYRIKIEVGNVTILINNAGVLHARRFLDYTPEEITQTMNVNVMSHFWILRAFLPAMVKNNRGHIVSVSCMTGIDPLAYMVPYSVSKFAVRGLMEALSDEFRNIPNNKIKLTNVYPFIVDTGLCKRPKIKYETVTPILSAKEVAREIMYAQKCNEQEIILPRQFTAYYWAKWWLPNKAFLDLKDTVDVSLDPDF